MGSRFPSRRLHHGNPPSDRHGDVSLPHIFIIDPGASITRYIDAYYPIYGGEGDQIAPVHLGQFTGES
jgi:hypothetical protein